ncbi:MAG: hypothetical protein FRX48_09392 [Lasallia pustulata]|uniref:Inosine/uridine-preferring nucleoside hydrolase domain-containing protein n=1 Tax=Lasallia pustulata TaxID=136370 RepID=A0A5M8PD96_9LECA|nr:MAG: hypothetical protein FRX48_09392 [Lasallia pustulata]
MRASFVAAILPTTLQLLCQRMERALDAGMEILALASDTCDTWVDQTTLHALALLEIGNLSCIPVTKGVTYPLVQTPQRLSIWQQLWGRLQWQGVFAPENLTAESLGADPTSGDPSRISRSAFIEGFPNTTALPGYTAAAFMIEQVHAHPGQVSIFSAGALTNVATAIRLDPTFAPTAKELILMGGYLDTNLYQLQSPLAQDISSDFNLLADPTAAHITLTAAFPSISLAGNVANQQYLSPAQRAAVLAAADPANPYARLLESFELAFPLWDETAAAVMAWPELVTASVVAYADVDTAFDGPDLGRLHVWAEEFAPPHTRRVNYVLGIDQEAFYERVMHAVAHPPKAC